MHIDRDNNHTASFTIRLVRLGLQHSAILFTTRHTECLSIDPYDLSQHEIGQLVAVMTVY